MRADPILQEVAGAMDSLFTALDGRPIAGAESAHARVLGIHDDGRELWIQVARGDDTTNTAVVRLSRLASIRHAAAAIERWVPASARLPRIINAMRGL